jgi:two-component system, NarL family, capsular synthesis sensor histidine kinase RcsC
MESYTSMISHEFRAPLATVIMLLEMVITMTTNAKSLKLIKTINSQLHLLLSLVYDILDLKYLQTGKIVADIATFNPLDLLNLVIDIFSEQAETKQVRLELRTVDNSSLHNLAVRHFADSLAHVDLPTHLRGDMLRLKQVLINLL